MDFILRNCLSFSFPPRSDNKLLEFLADFIVFENGKGYIGFNYSVGYGYILNCIVEGNGSWRQLRKLFNAIHILRRDSDIVVTKSDECKKEVGSRDGIYAWPC